MRLGCLYVFGAEDGMVKIGVSIHPEVRRSQVEAASGRAICKEFVSPPFEWYVSAEKFLHAKFAAHRMRGEWFSIDFDEAVKAAHMIGISLTTGEWCSDARYIRGVEAREVFIRFMDGDPSTEEMAAFFMGFGSLSDDMDHAALCDNNRSIKELTSLVNDSTLLFGDSVIVELNKRLSENLAVLMGKYKPLLDLMPDSQKS